MKEEFIKKYLFLIDCREPEAATPSITALKTMMEKHIHSVHFNSFAFLNMDSSLIELDPYQCLENKFTQQQGGVCFELNITFNQLLKVLGYQTYLVDALMDNIKDRQVPHYDIATHNTIVVVLEEKYYLVDVGLGNYFRNPIPFLEEYQDNTGLYRVVDIRNPSNSDQVFCLERFSTEQNQWLSQYRFSLHNKEPIDFLANVKKVCDASCHLSNEFFMIKPYAADSYKIVDGGRNIELMWIHKAPGINEKLKLTPASATKILTEEFHMKASEIDKVLSECEVAGL